MTGGRIKRLKKHLHGQKFFLMVMACHGDGVRPPVVLRLKKTKCWEKEENYLLLNIMVFGNVWTQ